MRSSDATEVVQGAHLSMLSLAKAVSSSAQHAQHGAVQLKHCERGAGCASVNAEEPGDGSLGPKLHMRYAPSIVASDQAVMVVAG